MKVVLYFVKFIYLKYFSDVNCPIIELYFYLYNFEVSHLKFYSQQKFFVHHYFSLENFTIGIRLLVYLKILQQLPFLRLQAMLQSSSLLFMTSTCEITNLKITIKNPLTRSITLISYNQMPFYSIALFYPNIQKTTQRQILADAIWKKSTFAVQITFCYSASCFLNNQK